MNGIEKGVTGFLLLLGFIALATTLVGPGKQTPGVIDALGGATSSNLLAAQGK